MLLIQRALKLIPFIFGFWLVCYWCFGPKHPLVLQHRKVSTIAVTIDDLTGGQGK